MRSFITLALMAAFCGWLNGANAQLEVFASSKPESVFFGAEKNIFITLHNAGSQTFNGGIRARIFQTSSATAVLLGEVPWKKLQVLPSQTVLESTRLDFPAVNAETQFLVQWLDDANHVIGATRVSVYPTNLFQTLEPRLCETNFGVLDPGNQIKPLLKAQGISFADLGEMELDNFSGQLAIIGPFQSEAQMPEGLANKIKAIAKKNIAVVWIQPPEPSPQFSPIGWERKKIQPSFYCVQKSRTAVVVVQPNLVSNLFENPESQVALIYFCHLALKPQPTVLPDLSSNFNL